MTFTSWPFVFFLAIVLILLAFAPSRTARQALILAASLFFYAYWNLWYLLLLATPSLIDFYCARFIEKSDADRWRKFWVAASVISTVSLLLYFKYAGFFIKSASTLVGAHWKLLNVLLPVGISFYTFKTLSYTIDVYRREISPCRNWWRYAMFVTYFPELVAGPIVRASVFLPQMARSLRPSWRRAYVGFQAILLGVTKKLLVADRLSTLVDPVFAHPAMFSSFTVICAVIAYSIQIYCDFSGYSDMAIGISRIIGFDLPENFDIPYISTSITEFWRRWHITLSRWLRDYLYIPLGGNRRGNGRTYLNLMITMIIGGLWHGANWTFVVWGIMHGMALAVHKLWTSVRCGQWRVPPVAAWAISYGFVCFAWIFFRSPDFKTALILLQKVTLLDTSGITYYYLPLFVAVPVVVIGHAITWYVEKSAANAKYARYLSAPARLATLYERTNGRFAIKPHRAAGYYVLLPLPSFTGTVCVILWLFALYMFSPVSSSPFIYFQF